MTIWLAVLTTAVVLTLGALIAHHVWEERRDSAARERHDTLMKAIEDHRRVTLQAITDRTNLSGRVALLEAWKATVEKTRAERAPGLGG
jgi:predicted negative regulator of RcsB-dependent stress response